VSADQTIDTFCTALQNKDYQTAYDQLSDNARSGYSETQFASDASAISTCSHDFPVQVGGTATAILTLGNSAGQTRRDKAFLIKDSNGDWKIDRLQKVA